MGVLLASLASHRVALIGLGLASAPHVQSLLELGERVEVVWAVSRTRERLHELAGKIPFPATVELERVLRDRTIRSAIVLTPPNTHLALIERLTAEGKHILLEKPLEVDLAKSCALVKPARRTASRSGWLSKLASARRRKRQTQCRFLAAPATFAAVRSNGCTETRKSPRFTRAPTRSSALSSRASCYRAEPRDGARRTAPRPW